MLLLQLKCMCNMSDTLHATVSNLSAYLKAYRDMLAMINWAKRFLVPTW